MKALFYVTAGAGFILLAAVFVLLHMPIAHAASCFQTGVASWYGTESGRRTANGERFPTGEATAAHRTLPFNTRVRVTDMRTGRSVVVRLNDRGPAKWTGAIIDLNPAAADRLDIKRRGRARVCLSTP